MQPEGFPTSQSWSGNFWWSPEKHWLQESRQNRGIPNWRHVPSWHRREDSKPEVKHKWKGIQVNFLEELTLLEKCLDVWDFKQPQAIWEWCWLPCRAFQRSAADAGLLHGRSEMRKPRILAGPVSDPSASQQITHLFKASMKRREYQTLRFSNGLGRQRGNGIHSILFQNQWTFICVSWEVGDGANMKAQGSVSFTVMLGSRWELSPSLPSSSATWMRLSAKRCFCKRWY